jgi:hypothetical protein
MEKEKPPTPAFSGLIATIVAVYKDDSPISTGH